MSKQKEAREKELQLRRAQLADGVNSSFPLADGVAWCTPAAYTWAMRFIETPVFTRAVVTLLDDDEYRGLQMALLQRPERGAVIRGSGGLGKARWQLPGQGKRGGLRVIYYWDQASETFYMLFAYPKNEQEDLTAQQLRVLSRLVREEFG
jgi:hypothetical protein